MERKFKYIVKHTYSCTETPGFACPEKNEVLRVFFDQAITGTKRMSVWVTTFGPGKGPGLHSHPEPVEELLYVIQGKGRERVGDEVRDVEVGDAIFIPPGVEHEIINTGDGLLSLLVVVSPPGAVEKDLYAQKVKRVIPTLQIEL